jgi:hypothetical protein
MDNVLGSYSLTLIDTLDTLVVFEYSSLLILSFISFWILASFRFLVGTKIFCDLFATCATM